MNIFKDDEDVAYRGLPITMILLTVIGSVGHVCAQTAEPKKRTPPSLKANPALLQALKNLGQKYAAIEEIHPVIKALKDPGARFANGEELIFALIVDNLKLGEIFGFKAQKGARLGFNEYVKALDLAIKLENTLDEPVINYSGWFINEDNTFRLSIDKEIPENSHVIVSGERIALPVASYQVDFDDVYIDTSTMSRWFGIGVEYDYVGLSIRLSPQNQLPVQARLARRNRETNTITNRKQAKHVLRDNGYQLVSPITEDMVISVSQSETDTRYSYSLLGVQDFAFMKTEYFYSGNDRKVLNDGRLSFSKESVDGDLLGIGATQFAVGDVAPKGITGGTSGRLSQGFSISNRKIGAIQSIDTTSVSGAMKVGWDVELYRNGILLDRENEVEDGRYEFDDIPLLFGTNEFELVFYGPQGQIRKEQFTRVLDKSIYANNGVFDFSFNALDKTLLGVRDIDSNAGYLAAGTYDTVIGEKILFSTGLSSQFGGDADQNSLSLRASTHLFDTALLGINFSANDLGANMLTSTIRTNVGEHAFSGTIGFVDSGVIDAESDQNITSKNLNTIVSGRVQLPFMPKLSYQNRVDYKSNSLGEQNTSVINSIGTNILGTAISADTSFNKVQNDSEVFEEHIASFNIQRLLGPVYTILQSNFDLNLGEFSSITTQFSYDFTDDIKSKLTLQHTPSTNQNRINLDMRWRQDLFDLSSKLTHSDATGWNASMFLRFGMSFLDDSKQFVLERQSMASRGSVVAQLFIDENMNGNFDAHESPLENVKVEAVQGLRSGVTDTQGMAIISGIPHHKVSDIEIDLTTLPDPYLVPSQNKFAIRSRAGYVEVISIPLVYSSEIDGTLFVEENGNINTLSYGTVNLVNTKDEIVKTVKSEFDGYYLFTEVLPGEYSIRIDADYLRDKNIKMPDARYVSLDTKGEIASGQDFVLKPRIFDDKYIVSLGTFASNEGMQTYWNILQSQTQELANYNPFQVTINQLDTPVNREEDVGGTHLGLQWFDEKQDALEQCSVLQKNKISCSVQKYSMEVQ